MKAIKKLLACVLAAVSLLAVCACADFGGKTDTGGNSDIISTTPVAQPDGQETVVTACLNTGINPTYEGYADVALASARSNLRSNTTMANGVFQYNYTVALHNSAIGSDIRLQFYDYGWDDALIQRLTLAFANGSGPDIVTGETQMTAYMQQGYLVAFPDWLETYVKENMHPLAYSAMMDEEGNIYGVAPCATIPVLIWNKAVLRAAGIDEGIVENGVDTWAEWLDVGKKLDEAGSQMGGIYCGSNYGGYLRSTPFVYMAGGSLVDGNNAAAFVSDANASALQFLRDMSEYNTRGIMAANSEDTFYNRFNSGRSGYLVEGSWRILQSIDEGLDVGFCALPTVNEGDETQNVAIGATYMGVAYYSENQDAAFEAIRCYIDEAAQMEVAKSDLRPCTYLPIADSAEYAELAPNQSKVYEIIKNDTSLRMMPSFASGQEEFWEAWGSALTGAVYGDTDIMTLLQTAQSRVN